MNEEAKKLIIEYKRCEARLDELDYKISVAKNEYKERIKDSFNQNGVIDFDKQITCMVSEEHLRDCLFRYKMAIRDLLINKFDLELYFDKVAIPYKDFDIKDIKVNIPDKKDIKYNIPEHLYDEFVKLIKSTLNEMNKSEEGAFKDKNN